MENDLDQRFTALTEELNANLAKVLELLVDGLNGRIDQGEKNLESLEERVAMLTAGYAELATMITALVSRVGAGSPEEIEAFNQAVVQGRKEMLEILKSQRQEPFTPHPQV